MTLDEARKLALKHIDMEHRRGNWKAISMSDVTTDAAYAILEALSDRDRLLRRWLRVWEEGAGIAGNLPNETRDAVRLTCGHVMPCAGCPTCGHMAPSPSFDTPCLTCGKKAP